MFTTLAIAGWLGILTSISPCPLATNVAAVSFLARRVHSRRMAVAGAVAYSAGRAGVCVVIGLLVAGGLAAAPALSTFLQRDAAPFTGPLLIVVGLVLLGWLTLPVRFGLTNQSAAERLAALGFFGEFLLGMVFAFSFCPVSAALFFGTLLPLALAAPVAWPPLAVYGVATAFPVALITILMALGAGAHRKILACVQRWQGPAGKWTGVIILLVGVWLTLRLIF